MSLRTKIVSTLVSFTVVAGAIAGATQPSAARSLSRGEVAAIAGVGGFIVGSAFANANRGPVYYDHYRYRSSWERHVDRCLARYRTYEPSSDTYVGFDGRLHYCRL